MNQNLQVQLTLLLSSSVACLAFTISLGKTAMISSFVGRNNRQLRPQSNGPELLQVQVTQTSLFFDSYISSAESSLLSSSAGDDSLLSSEEETNSDIGDEFEIEDAAVVPNWKRILMFYKYNKGGCLKSKLDKEDDGLTFKQKLAKMGLSALLSYGFVSNISYCVTVSLAWFGFSKKTGLSPLSPGQWKGFLAVYAGFYVFNNFIRPMRLAVSVGVTPYFDWAVEAVQRKTKLSKSAAIGIVVFLANVCGTTSLMSLGIYIASLAAGVSIFPKGI